jgi:uncharacterized protein (TIGR02001 family)
MPGISTTPATVRPTSRRTPRFSLNLHVGQSDGDFWDAGPDGSYFDWSIGVSRNFGNFALSLKYIDGSDLKSTDGTPGDVFSSEDKVYFSVATTLPWGK